MKRPVCRTPERKGYRFQYHVRRDGFIPWSVMSRIFADAAAWLEANPQYDAHTAIRKATDKLSDRVASIAPIAFRDTCCVWAGDDESVLMLCFAAAVSATGDL